ncbi:MAG: hypothetical protein ABIR82_03690 [Nocardioides sp.]
MSVLIHATVFVEDLNDVIHRCQVPDGVPVGASLPGNSAEEKPDLRIAHLAGVVTQLRDWGGRGDRAAVGRAKR